MNIMFLNLPPVIRMTGGVAASVCSLMCSQPLLTMLFFVLTAVFLLPKGKGDEAPIEVPGETMPAFADRLMEHLRSCGLRVSPKTVRDILAEYAATGRATFTRAPGTKSVAIGWLSAMLSLYFGEQHDPEHLRESTIFVPDETALSEFSEAEVLQEGAITFSAVYGMSKEAFRGILRETEDEWYLSEEFWRQTDDFFAEAAKRWNSEVGNPEIRSAERMSSVLLALGEDGAITSDRVMAEFLLPAVIDSAKGLIPGDLRKLFEEYFPLSAMPMSGQVITFANTQINEEEGE